MFQHILVPVIKAIVFVVLLQVGATLQMWSGWQGFLARGLAWLPALAFGWFHLEYPATGKRFPIGDAAYFYLSIIVVGFVLVDVLHINLNVWLCLVAFYLVVGLHKIGKMLFRMGFGLATEQKN